MTTLGAAGDVMGIMSGLNRGGALGYAGAGLSGANLANNATKLATGSPLFSGATASGLGAAGNVLGIVNGLKQGGVAGDLSAGVNAAGLYGNISSLSSSLGGSSLGASAGLAAGLGTAAGALGGMYALYGLFENQSQQSPAAMAVMNTNNANSAYAAAKYISSGNDTALIASGDAPLASDFAQSLGAMGNDMSSLAAYENNPANAAALEAGTSTMFLPAQGGAGSYNRLYIQQS
jgi:hypothetical protein